VQSVGDADKTARVGVERKASGNAAAGGGGGSKWRMFAGLQGGSKKSCIGLEAQLAAAVVDAGVDAADIDMDAEMYAAMDTAAMFAFPGDV
jgi:hypothetical protein